MQKSNLISFPLLLLAAGTISAQQPLQWPIDSRLDVSLPIASTADLALVSLSFDGCDETAEGCCATVSEDEGGGGDDCGCANCAARRAAAKANPCAGSHKGVFYANDFSYLLDPDYHGDCLGDRLKLRPVGSCGHWGTLDLGGQLRLRQHHEVGMGQEPNTTRFQDTENDFMLTRLRLYSDWKITDNVRFYAEGIYAGLTAEDDYVPRSIDENYGDMQNLFVDLKATDTITVRVGRQELLYGSQRVVSPLDWANTRRTFEGIKIMHECGDWAVDGFFTHFVPVNPTEFDEADYDQRFYGMYGVYSGYDDATVDFYYLGYDDDQNLAPIASDFSLHTIGMRVTGSRGDWLYELEGAPQFGRQSGLGLDDVGGFATAGLGRKLDMSWSPTIWFYYDYASGNNIGGDFNRYNQLFPLAHKYLGFIDATQRANIESPNVLLTMTPHSKVDLLFWYYHLMANQDTDIVPSIGGTPNQTTNSKDWGDEIDVIVKYNYGPRSNILFGYSHFWTGNKIAPPGGAVDADFFYTQWELNF